MTARRGTPSYVISDNGANFVRAEKAMRKKIHELDQEKVVKKTTQHHKIEWKFNLPSTTHFGGVFESMIKSAI